MPDVRLGYTPTGYMGPSAQFHAVTTETPLRWSVLVEHQDLGACWRLDASTLNFRISTRLFFCPYPVWGGGEMCEGAQNEYEDGKIPILKVAIAKGPGPEGYRSRIGATKKST